MAPLSSSERWRIGGTERRIRSRSAPVAVRYFKIGDECLHSVRLKLLAQQRDGPRRKGS
jgi:hypothetical protein